MGLIKHHPKRYMIQIGFTVQVGGIAFAAAIGTIILYSLTTDKLKERLEFGSAALATAAAMTGASYVSQDLKRSAESALIDRTFSFIARWNSPDFSKENVLGLIREMRNLNNQEKKDHQIKRLEEEDLLKSELLCIHNFLEEMALSISSDAVDDEVLEKFFRGIVKSYYEAFIPWLNHRKQETSRKYVYEQFENLYNRWEGNGNLIP